MTDNTQKPIATRRDLESHIIAKAWKDPKYKDRLLKDPKGVLSEELKSIDPSIELPEDLKVASHEEDKNTYHIVLPRNPQDIALSEVVGDNLEDIAPQTIAVVAVVVGGVVANGGAVVNAAVNTNAAVNANAAVNVNAVSG